MQKILFLDRDGVINIERNYVYKKAQFIFIEDIFSTCLFFQNQGFKIIVVTNQSGIARKYYSRDDFLSLSRWMIKKFKQRNIEILDVLFCPHHPDFSGQCDCRKPAPGLFLEAFKKYTVDLEESIMIGDKISDIYAANEAGINNAFLVKTGHSIPLTNELAAIQIFNNSSDIVNWYKNKQTSLQN